ncbi:MAG: HAMP domain-containing histidine kinase [Eubacteriaceae bacterium]|nr:HAMP domain-containing histidine kinase [Eubacteriaceae bacterium]
MAETLRKKFTGVSMAAVSCLILLLVTMINAANIILTSKQTERSLYIIWENEGALPPLPTPPGEKLPSGLFGGGKNDYDTMLSSNYFVAIFNLKGEIIRIDVSRTSEVSEEEARQAALEIYGGGKEEGRKENYRFLIKSSPRTGGKVAVFLDNRTEIISYLRVLLLSVLVGALCWAAMLPLVALLSAKAIKPIADNMERQRQFVTDAGHEIKTPLAIISANTEALELYQQESKYSRNIKDQVSRLSSLMNDLLLLARSDEYSAAPYGGKAMPEGFSLSEVASQSLRQFKLSMELKGISLTSEISSEITINADKEGIKRLLSILLDNAVKYTNENGIVNFGLFKQDKRIILQIENTVESLPEAAPEKLFDRFYRADASRSQKTEGYGIGLSAAKAIARANNGVITAEYKQGNAVCFTCVFKTK